MVNAAEFMEQTVLFSHLACSSIMNLGCLQARKGKKAGNTYIQKMQPVFDVSELKLNKIEVGNKSNMQTVELGFKWRKSKKTGLR